MFKTRGKRTKESKAEIIILLREDKKKNSLISFWVSADQKKLNPPPTSLQVRELLYHSCAALYFSYSAFPNKK